MIKAICSNELFKHVDIYRAVGESGVRWPGGVRWPVAFFSDLVAQWLILAAGFSSAIHVMCIEPFFMYIVI